MKTKIKFNIHDLNFILTFAGFAFFTSITDSIPSIYYRAVAFLLAIVCLLTRMFRSDSLPGILRFFLLFAIILDIKVAYCLFADSSVVFASARNMALLFIFCITLIPGIAISVAYKHIHWRTVLISLFFMLLFVILKGYISSLDNEELTRMALNKRQSTLAFGDNSGYLLVLSISLLLFIKNISNKIVKYLWMSILLLGVVLSVLGLVRAGSRGPFISALMGVSFIIISLKVYKQLNLFIVVFFIISVFNITTVSLEKFAPVLFTRLANTIEEGDSSGRDVLFAKAARIMKENPVQGGNPVILTGKSEFTTYHNGYLDVGIGLGILGFTVYVMLNLWIVFNLLIHRSKLEAPERLFIGSQFFLSATRAMTGATIISGPNYILSIICALILVSNLRK